MTEVAQFLRFTPESVYQLVHRRKIPYVKVCGALRFKRSDIDTWIEECTFRPGAEERTKNTREDQEATDKEEASRVLTDVMQMVEQSRRKYLETSNGGLVQLCMTVFSSSIRSIEKEVKMGLYRQDGSESWWMSFTAGGRRYRKSTGTGDKKLAGLILADIELKILKQEKLGIQPELEYPSTT